LLATLLLALCGAILVASFIKSDLTRNDFERFDDLRLMFTFFTLFVGLGAAYISLYGQRPAIMRQTILITTLMCTALLLLSFPVGSKDVFGYAFYGKMWRLYGANPYVATPADFPADAWQPYLQVRWRTLPTAYGPLFLWQSWLVAAVAGSHLWVAIWIHKTLAAITWIGIVCLADSILHRTIETPAVRLWLLALVAWNPLFIFEPAGGGHNDIAMVLFVLATLWCWQARRFSTALALLAVSFWYKWYSIIFVPILLTDTLKLAGLRAALRHAAVWGSVAIASGVLFLSPLPGSLPSVIGQLMIPGAMRGVFPNELSPPLAALYWIEQAAGLFDTDLGGRIFDVTRFALFGVAAVAIFIRQWRAAASFAVVVEGCFLIGSAVFLFLITMLLPWHLLVIIAVGLITGREPFVLAAVGLTVLALLSYFLTFAVATVMLAVVVGTVWMMRRLGSHPRTALL